MPENKETYNFNAYNHYYVISIEYRFDYLFVKQPNLIDYIRICMTNLDKKSVNFDEIKTTDCYGHFLDANTEEVFVIFRGYFKVDYNAHTIKVYIKSKQDRFSGNKVLNKVYTFSPEQSFRRNGRLVEEIVKDLESR